MGTHVPEEGFGMTLYQCPICKTVVWFDKPQRFQLSKSARQAMTLEGWNEIYRVGFRVPHCNADCCDMDPVETES